MKYVLTPSLEHIALVKIAVALWNQNDVGALITSLPSTVYSTVEEWQKIEDKVIEKVPQLLLPELLKEKLLGFIKPIGVEICVWMQHISERSHLNVKLPVELYWTSQGTIDRKRTAEVLCNDENLDISKRFRLAYMYCLEDNILELWKKMPEDLRKYILDGGTPSWTYEPILVSVWTHATGQEERHNKLFSYEPQFGFSAAAGNKAATEYFLQKLTPRERERSLIRIVKCVSDADVLCFLLTQMDEEQQVEVFQTNPYKIICFLDWPFQIFFMEIANLIWEFLLGWHYVPLLKRIVEKINSGYKDWNYIKVFEEILQKSPNNHYITDESGNHSLLRVLLQIKDKEIASLFLKNANSVVVEKLVCSGSVPDICVFFQWINNLNLLEIFIQEFLPSKEEIIKFKKKLETMTIPYYFKDRVAEIKHKLDNFILLYDGSICEYDKRSAEGSESSSSKRLHSLQ